MNQIELDQPKKNFTHGFFANYTLCDIESECNLHTNSLLFIPIGWECQLGQNYELSVIYDSKFSRK